MKRLKLRFENIQQIVGSDDVSVMLLTDEARRRALSIVCDELTTRQFILRINSPHAARLMLPEVLVQMLPGDYEMTIYGIHNGQYQVVLSDKEFDRNVRMRLSDAVLLSIIAGYPLYIEQSLMMQQSVPFEENARGVAIPINTMDMKRLKQALQHAIEEENYELASHLRDEINRRKKS